MLGDAARSHAECLRRSPGRGLQSGWEVGGDGRPRHCGARLELGDGQVGCRVPAPQRSLEHRFQHGREAGCHHRRPRGAGLGPVGKKRLALFPGQIACAAFSPDAKLVVTGGADDTARVWTVASQQSLIAFRRPTGVRDAIAGVAFSPDGRLIATASVFGEVAVWTPPERGSLVVLRGHKGPVYAADFSPDGKLVVTASADMSARVWSRDGRSVAKLRILLPSSLRRTARMGSCSRRVEQTVACASGTVVSSLFPDSASRPTLPFSPSPSVPTASACRRPVQTEARTSSTWGQAESRYPLGAARVR